MVDMENNGIQALDDEQTTEVVGGFTSLTDWHLRKTRCDDCHKVIESGEYRLHSKDNKHHLCEACFSRIKSDFNYRKADGTPAYVEHIKNMYDIEV